MKPTLTSIYLGRRTTQPESKGGKAWEHFAYNLTLAHEGRSMSFDYCAGLGHVKFERGPTWRKPANAIEWRYGKEGPKGDGWNVRAEPTLFDALFCVLMDARSYDDARNFEDWCDNFGYDTASKRAERMYQACGQTSKDVRHVLGRALYDELAGMEEDALKAWCGEPAAATAGQEVKL